MAEKKQRVNVDRALFIDLAFNDPEIQTHEDIAAKTNMALGSVTAKIYLLRKELLESGIDEDKLRKLPQKPRAVSNRKTSKEILEELWNRQQPEQADANQL